MDLDEFAESEDVRRGYRSALDKLPEDVQETILSSSAGHATVARWLHSEGHTGITQGIVATWRANRGWSRD